MSVKQRQRDGDTAEQHDFRKLRADGKARVTELRIVFLDGRDPFQMMPLVVVTGETVARNDLRNLRQGRMFCEVRKFLFAAQLHEKLIAVIIRRKHGAFDELCHC